MAHHRAVEAEIPGQQQGVGPLRLDLGEKGVGELLHIAHELAVRVFCQRREKRTVVGQRRGDIVQIARHGNAEAGFAALSPCRAAEQEGEQERDEGNSFHVRPPFLFRPKRTGFA